MLGFPTRTIAYCAPLALLVWIGAVHLAIGQEPAVAASPGPPAAQAAASPATPPAQPAPAAATPAPTPPAASTASPPGTPAPQPPSPPAPPAAGGASQSPSDGSAKPAGEPPKRVDQPSPGESHGSRGRRPEGDRPSPGGPPGGPSRAYDPDTSFTKLAHPEIAERMGLTDQQRSQVATILTERAAAIASADEQGRARAMVEAEQKLAGVLTADQRASWLDKLQRRSLRFNFRFQLWADVLEWFAEEADLSLVINNPPPGTFNYSDTKEYTPEEAIDVLNGVLQTKGFTLIRRDKMLIVHDLSQGIPDGLIPRVSLEELDRRGKFELVSVQFPLGRKEVPVVEAEIKPLLGPYGKVVALPATKQLVVSDMAGVMRAISAVIESVPEPPQPKKEEPKPEPPKEKPIPPELVVYPITKADPQAVQDVLLKMVPTVTLEYDAKRGQLYAYTTPNFHATIAKVLESMEAELPPELDRYLEIYSIKGTSAAAATAAPSAGPGGGPGGGDANLIRDRYGNPRYRIDQFGRRVPTDSSRSFSDGNRYSRYSRGESGQAPGGQTPGGPAPAEPASDALLNTLHQLAPGAEIHIDRTSSRLMAFATREEHEIIKSVIEKLGGVGATDEAPLVEVYPITHSDPESLRSMFESLFPGVQINIDRATSSMVVFAYPSEQATIKSTLERLMPPAAEGQPPPRSTTELRFYPLKDRYPPTLQSVLSGLVPNAQVTYDSINDRLIVVGSAHDHEIISRGVEQLETAKAEDRSKLVVYPVTPVQKARFTSVLRTLTKELPGVVVLPESKPGEVAVWANALQQEAIAGILKQFEGEGAAAEGESQLVAYPIKTTDPMSTEEMLKDLFPGARMLADRRGAKLLVWATAAEHEQIKKSIAAVTSEPPEEQPRFETYTIRNLAKRGPGGSRVFESHLNELVPKASLTLDMATGELIVWGTPEEQTLVRTAIEKLGQGDSPENSPSLKIYPLGDLEPDIVRSLLGELTPSAQLSIGAKSGNLVALAVPADQAMIQKTLDELQQSELLGNTAELRFHPLKGELPANVLKLLAEQAPKAEITADNENNRLMVVAAPADHEKITATIAKVEEAGATGPEVRFYPLENSLPPAVLSILKTLAPKAQITPDASGKYLTVVATPFDHEVVKKTMEQATSTLPPEEKPQLVVYAVTAAQQNRFQAILSSVTAELSSVKVIPDTAPGQLSIWAKPSEHEVLRGILDELRQELPPEEQFQLVAYPLKSADPESVTKVLGELFPNTKITLDANSNRLLIWTRAEEHAAIKPALEQIDVDRAAEEQRRFEVYPIGVTGLTAASRAARSSELLASLQTLVPNAKLTVDPQSGDLLAFATPAEHEILRTAVERLGRPAAIDRTSQLEVYQLTTADPAAAMSLLQGLAPRAEITLDSVNKRLMVLAPAETQATIRNTLAQIQPTEPGPNDPEVRVLNLKQKPAKALSAVLARLAPKAEVTVDEEGKRLVVVANQADQELIRRTVEQIDGALAAEEENTLMVFPVAPAQRKRFEAVVQSLTKEMPDVEIIKDDEPTQLSVWAKPSEHKVIGEILQQLKAGMAPETQRRFEAYSIQGAIGYETTRSGQLMTAATLTTGLQELVPGAKLMIDAKNNKLIAWASPEEHAMLKEAVEKLGPGGGQGAPVLQIYKLSRKAPETLVAGLQKLVPGADVSLDAAGSSLTVVGTPDDQQTVKESVDRLAKSATEGAQPYFEAYQIRGLGGRSSMGRYYHFQSFMTNLQPLVPNAKLSVDYESGSLTAFATAEEHAILKTSIEKLTFAGPGNTPELKVYTLKTDVPETLSDGLRELAPRARVSIDAGARQLTVVASSADQQIVKETLDKVDQAASEKEKPFFKVYAVTGISADPYGYGGRHSAARNMIEQLQGFAPKAKMSIDSTSGNILVFATQEEHDAIESALSGLTNVGSSEHPATLAVYRMQNADERAVFQLLQNLAPKAKLTLDYRTDSIMALAVAEDHEIIKNALAQLDPGAAGPNAAELRFYTLREAPPRSLIEGLRELAPKAQITYDAETRKLMVIATAANHTVIEKNLSTIQEKSAGEAKPELAIYPIRSADPAAVEKMLQNQFPEVRLQLDEKNDRLMVWALAEQQGEISKAIETMDAGEEGGSQEKTVAYSIDKVDAKTAVSILESLAPDMKISSDLKGKQIVAFGRERDHKLVAEAIEQMEAGPDETHKPYLMIYPVGDAAPAAVSEMLTSLVPAAKVVVDAESDSLAVFAKSEDQETARAAIESMGAAAVGAGKPMVMNYTLKEIPVASAMQILRLAVPKAQLATGSDPRQLLAWASARDHQTIKAALETVDVAAPEGTKATAAIYTLEGINPNYTFYTLRTLRDAVPEASMTLAADPTQIVVWARPEDHETIKQLVKSIVEQPAETAQVMEIYTFTSGDAAGAMQVLASIVPQAKLSVGKDSSQLVAWARPADQAKIKQAIGKLEAAGARATMKIYTLEKVETQSVIRMLRSIVPDAVAGTGADARQLIVWATEEQHTKVDNVIREMSAEGPPEKAPLAVTYTLGSFTAATAQKVLAEVAPDATITEGEDPYQLIIFARPDEHAKIEETLKRIDAEGASGGSEKAVVYELESADARQMFYILGFLQKAVPEATIIAGASPTQVVAWARPKGQEKIKELVEQLGDKQHAPTAVVYDAGNVSSATLTLALRQIVPDAVVTPGAMASQMVVWAKPADQEKVKEVVDRLTAADSAELAPTAVTYSLENIDAATAMRFLQLAAPQAQFSQGKETNQLIALATPKNQDLIKLTLEKIDVAGPADKSKTLGFYQLETTEIRQLYYVSRFLRESVPEAELTPGLEPGQVIAWARPKDHEKIAQIIEKIKGGEENAPKPVVYGLKKVNSTILMTMLRNVVPEAIPSAGADPYQLIVWARPGDHKKIQALVDELGAPEPPETAPATVNYTVAKITAASAMQVLRQVAPQAQLTPGADQYQFVAWARPEDHELIAETLAKIDIEGPADKQASLVVYNLKNTTATAATAMVRQIAPMALSTPGVNPYQLIVWARPNEHKDIQKAVDQMAAQDSPETAFKAVTYTLEEITAASAMQILTLAVPQAQVSAGLETYQLVVWARPEDHALIEKTLAQIDTEGPEDKQAKAVVYKLETADLRESYYVMRFLMQSVPEARFTTGVTEDQIVAWARPKDHELIQQLIDQVHGGTKNAPKMVIYDLKNVTAATVIGMLRQAIPDAATSPGTDPYQLVVWARPTEQARVQQIVDELSASKSPETVPKPVTYTLDQITAASAMEILRLAVPQAQLSAGAEAYQIVAWARPEDHVLIEQTLKQIDIAVPDEKLAKVVVYRVGISDIRRMIYVLQFLQSAVPEARLTLGHSTEEIIAWARPKDHEEIKKLVDEFAETPETAPKVMVYSLEKMTAAGAMQLLSTAFPMARFTPGDDPYQLIVWARGDEQPKIEAAIRDLSQKEPEETAPRMVIYPLNATTTTQATAVLRLIVPQAQFGVGANTRQLIAWARPADHELIKKAVEEMGKEESAETAPRVEVYTVETVDAQTAINVLLKTVPEATVNAGSDARQLVALARPAEHEKIKATLDQLAKKGPEEKQPTIVVYPLATASAAAAMQVLTPVVPQAKFTVGQDPSKLIAWAYPEDHATIKAAVDQIEADSWLDGNRVMSVYPMKPEDVNTLLSLLDPAIRQHAQFVPDAERECLIVWSDKRYADAIRRTVEEYAATVPPLVKPTAVVYRFEEADSLTAFTVLRTLVPKAMIAIDQRTGAIVATAMPEDHEKIRNAIEEMNRDAIEKAPRLQVHRITSADPANVLATIQNLFRAERDVQLSLDAANDSLIAYASPIQHQKIDDLITEIEKGTALDSALQLKLYSLKNVDSYAATEVLNDMFQKQGVRVDLTVDRYRNQLVAMARPEQHAKIDEILKEFRTEERILEIFQLEYVELDIASLAIRRLFSDESYLSQPEVDPDPATGQLLVRASAEQLEKVRQLLIRMGETGLTPTQRSTSGNLRVVPFKGNVQEVLKELQKVWPTLRTNEIRVVTPADIIAPVVPETKTEKTPETKPDEAKVDKLPEAKETPKTDVKKKPEAGAKTQANPKPEPKAGPAAKPQPAKAEGKKPAATAVERRAEPKADAPSGAPGPEGEKGVAGPAGPPARQPSSGAAAAVNVQQAASPPAAAAPDAGRPSAQDTAATKAEPPEVLVIAGDDTITIASEDQGALDELETLLRTISARANYGSRDYTIYQIKNTTATQVAQTLQQLFRTTATQTGEGGRSRYGYGSRYGGYGGYGGYGSYGYGGYGSRPSQPPLIIPDDRLNTILVKGSRADRQTIEAMLEILDTAEMPDTVAAAFEPKTIRIEHTEAARVAQMVQTVYRSYFAAAPASSSFAPQLTIDEATNSLILRAPPQIVDTITKFAESLDTAASEDPSRKLRVIPLKNANAARVQEALNAMMRGATGGYGTSLYRPGATYSRSPSPIARPR